jgi:hypothetical protein
MNPAIQAQHFYSYFMQRRRELSPLVGCTGTCDQ